MIFLVAFAVCIPGEKDQGADQHYHGQAGYHCLHCSKQGEGLREERILPHTLTTWWSAVMWYNMQDISILTNHFQISMHALVSNECVFL